MIHYFVKLCVIFMPLFTFQIIIMADWRDGTGGQNLAFLMIKFYNSRDFNSCTDVTFKLPDGSEFKAHKIILSVSSEVFYSETITGEIRIV